MEMIDENVRAYVGHVVNPTRESVEQFIQGAMKIKDGLKPEELDRIAVAMVEARKRRFGSYDRLNIPTTRSA